MLFLRSAGGDDARTGLFVLDLPDGDERAIEPASDDRLSAAERARRERVRESASGVVSYAADDAGRIVAVVLAGALHVADVDAGTVRSLDVPGSCFDPRPDPTGRHIAYASDGDLRVVAVDGSGDRLHRRQRAGDRVVGPGGVRRHRGDEPVPGLLVVAGRDRPAGRAGRRGGGARALDRRPEPPRPGADGCPASPWPAPRMLT